MRILIADDDPTVLLALELAMQRAGFDVLPATDGERAWELFEDQRPDLAILDVSMPRLDGVELMRLIRKAGEPYGLSRTPDGA